MLRSYFVNKEREDELNKDAKGAKIVNISISADEKSFNIFLSDNRCIEIYFGDELLLTGINFSEEV
jgi:hypothetical protein